MENLYEGDFSAEKAPQVGRKRTEICIILTKVFELNDSMSEKCILFPHSHILYMENKAFLPLKKQKIAICYPFVTNCKIFNIFTNIHRNSDVDSRKKTYKSLFLTDFDSFDCASLTKIFLIKI